MNYYDPMFYLCSEKMPFGIRVEVALKYEICGEVLERAVNTAIKRYPYFAVKIVKSGEEFITEKNDLPIKVFQGDLPYPLGSKEVNYHIVALSYSENKIDFNITHVITDGNGFTPFVKSVLYYYLCGHLKTELAPEDIRLADDELLEGETSNPYPEKEMAEALPFYRTPEKEFLRLADCGYVTEGDPISYCFHAKQSDVMKFSHENDASPCALLSSIMTKAIWTVHPDENKDIVSALSFNMRPALKAENNYRMLCKTIDVRYPKLLDKRKVREICTCTRGAVMVQSQPENVLYYAENKKNELQKLLSLPDIKAKCDVLSDKALKDSVNNTFSVSYVGRVDYGSLTEHIENIKIFTDGSTYKTIFIEISSFGEWFYISMQQGFSSDVYYKALLQQFKENGIEFIEDGVERLNTPKIALPEY